MCSGWRRPRRRGSWRRIRDSASASGAPSRDFAESFAKKLLHAPQMALRNDDADEASRWWWRCSGCSRWRWPPRRRSRREADDGCRARRRRREGQEGGRALSAERIVIGTRGSALARWQAGEVGRLLARRAPGARGARADHRHRGRSRAVGPGRPARRQRRLGRGDRGGAGVARDRRRGAQPQGRPGRAARRAGARRRPDARRSARRDRQPLGRRPRRAAARQPRSAPPACAASASCAPRAPI